MQDLYDRLVRLLGKPVSPAIDMLDMLSREFGETARTQQVGERWCFYDFIRLGFKLTFDKAGGMFTSFVLPISTPEVIHGGTEPYSGNLPYGITANDSRDHVESKIPGATMAVKDYRFDVDLRPLCLMFSFDPSGTQLQMVSVHFEAEAR